MAPLNKSLKTKSRIIKMTTQTLLDFDLGEESSSDSDFRIEDHDESDDEFSEQNNDDNSDNDDDDDDDSESDSESDEKSDKSKSIKNNNDNKINKTTEGEKSSIDLKEILKTTIENSSTKQKIPTQPICCACLGDRSDDANEIIECDGCGVSVHEGCYGVSDTNSISSTNSSCSTEPWFCEACRAGVINPNCELCPNTGGIFKETDVGKWVHLVCALYVPGVAFGEVDQLSSVTLFEMPYNKWGAKSCSLCIDERFSRTGVCIGCDAGMCKSYFHVTCAQSAGFLSEAHSEEVDHADPFYAHCKVHSDKTMIKHRKRNYNTLKFRMEQKKQLKLDNEKSNEKLTTEQQRIQRKLAKHQAKYRTNKSLKNEPWVPTQKISRLLTTSATAVKRLLSKADVMGIDTAALEFQEAQMASLVDVKKKWHIPPAFSVEFIAYYLDRITRLKDLKTNLENYVENNSSLLNEQKRLREEYDQKNKTNIELLNKNNTLKDSIAELHKQISILCPTKQLSTVENIGRPVIPIEVIPSTSQIQQQQQQQQQQSQPARPISVPTAAALKMGVGFPLTNLPGGIKDDTGRILSTQRQNKDELLHDCGICKRCNDQHLLAKCDTCHFYYHLGCLNPPLTRHPKKSKLYGWQCSECDKSDDSDIIVDIPKGPRKSRTRFNKDGTIIPVDPNYSADGNSSTKSEFSPAKRKLSTEKLIGPGPAHKSKSVDSVNSIIASTSINNSTTTPTTTTTTTPPTIFNGKITIKEFNNNPKKPYVKISKNINQQQETNHTKNLLNNFEKIDIIDINETTRNCEMATNIDVPIINNLSNEITTKKSHRKLLENSINISSPVNVKTQIDDPLAINCTDIDIQMSNDIITNTRKSSSTKSSKDKSIKKEKKERKNCIKAIELQNNIKYDNQSSDLQTNQSIMIADIDLAKITIPITTTNEQEQLQLHKQNRKRRKDKHKNKYNSDSEKSPNKEHKRKRKKKSHDRENPNESGSTVPKIKIKFKTLPLPGEAAPEPQFFYVSADMVRPMDTSRPTSVETVDDSTINNDDLAQNISSPSIEDKIISGATTTTKSIGKTTITNRSSNKIKTSTPKSSSKATTTTTTTTTTISPKLLTSVVKLSSPRRTSINKRRSTNSNNSSILLSSANNSITQISGVCDVCHDKVSNQNSVQCDECHKIYHFTCLDPPLKKTPKRRGYSWHCADCDPTDVEGGT